MTTYTFAQRPGTLNLDLERGDDFSFVVDFDISLIGYTVDAKVVSTQYGETVVVPEITITDATQGLVSVALTSSQTAALPYGTYRWEMSWTAPGDLDRTVLAGFVEVRR